MVEQAEFSKRAEVTIETMVSCSSFISIVVFLLLFGVAWACVIGYYFGPAGEANGERVAPNESTVSSFHDKSRNIWREGQIILIPTQEEFTGDILCWETSCAIVEGREQEETL